MVEIAGRKPGSTEPQEAPGAVEAGFPSAIGKRSEEDKVLMSPLVVILGGKEYEVDLLVIRDARAWRKQVAKVMTALMQYATIDASDPKSVADAIGLMLSSLPDEMADLFFGYARKLDRQVVEDTATEFELADALKKVMDVGFPLLKTMAGGWAQLVR